MKLRIIIALLVLSASIGFGPLTERGASARSPVPNPVVTNLNGGGAGSLRQAIIDADAGSTITFQAGLAGTITLASELDINKSLTIQGPGANLLTVSGDHAVRVFNIAAGNFDVTFAGLTIANGNSSLTGGGIINFSTGTVNVTGSTLSGNSAGGNGGGIINVSTGTVNVTGSTLSGNSSRNNGGGIYNRITGTVNVTGSTLSGNDADLDGGGIFNNVGTLTVTNSTLSGNSTDLRGGGILNNAGTLTVTNSTLSNNSADIVGGGIFNHDGTANVKNTIIAGNTASTDPDVSGAFTSQGHNLIGKNNGSTGFPAGNPNVNNDLVGTNAAPLDPLLDPLDNNGGPAQTMALLPCSPAIDKGNSSGLTTDQRGQMRPVDNPAIPPATGGDDSDIGAFEAQAPLVCNTPPTITSITISRQQGAAGTVSPIATVSDAQDAAGDLSVMVTSIPAGITVTGLTNTGGTITANVAAACTATLGDKTVGLQVTDSGLLMATANLTVNVTPSNAPVITPQPAISLWPPNHKYQTITMAQMLLGATDDCDGNLWGAVVIEKVTSDEPDNVKGGGDGETINDIVIAADCKSVQLRAERDEKKNGRAYSVTLRVGDASGNTTRAVFKVSVPLNQSGAPAVDSGAAQTKTSSCP